MIRLGPGIKGQRQVDAFAYITDIMPTMLEMAKLEHPKKHRDREVASMRGRSINGLLSGAADDVYGDEPIGAEMGGGKWLRQGDYKAGLVPPPFGSAEWQLFDLSKDPGETQDLSKTHPQKLKELTAAWDQYADEVGVVETTEEISL